MDAKQRRKELAQAYKARPVTGGAFVITCTANGKRLLQSGLDLQGSRNRFEFSQATGSCTYGRLAGDWKRYGGRAFTFAVLEELEKKETQTDREFREDLELLEQLWREKLGEENLY